MTKEQAKEILMKIQAGTATEEERKQAKLAYSILTANILARPGV